MRKRLERASSIGLVAVLLVACSVASVTPPSSQSLAAPSSTATAQPTAAATPAPTMPSWDALPEPANDPAGLAAQLVMAEGIIRDPNATATQLAWAGHMAVSYTHLTLPTSDLV